MLEYNEGNKNVALGIIENMNADHGGTNIVKPLQDA